MKTKGIVLFMIMLLVANAAWAVKKPKPGKVDPRIKMLTYSPRDVYRIDAHHGVTTHIVLGEDETIEHVSAGDTLAWHIVPVANHVFLKPIEDKADTNLTILTNRRTYNFELRVRKTWGIADKNLSFGISFRYPEDELREAIAKERQLKRAINDEEQYQNEQIIPERLVRAEQWNMDYSRKGSEEIAPSHVFDDGQFTYFQFPDEIDNPAIFMVNSKKEESLVNFHVRGKYIVVQRIAKQFIIRNGKLATCIFNEGFEQRKAPSRLPKITAEPNKEAFDVLKGVD
jgi:type IV secretion system protein VirB9